MAEATKQHGHICPLGTVIAVELVEDQVRERLLPAPDNVFRSSVGGPQPCVFRVSEESVKHLVVGEQDVWRVSQQLGGVRDEVLVAHLSMRADRTVVSDPDPPSDTCRAYGRVSQQSGDSMLLVSY